MDRTEFGMGAGFHGGPVMIDVGFSFKSGMWIHTMKGLNFSLGFTMTSFKGRDNKTDDASSGPSCPEKPHFLITKSNKIPPIEKITFPIHAATFGVIIPLYPLTYQTL